MMKFYETRTFEVIRDFFLIALGAVIAAFALEEFLVPNTILDGGVIGIGMIINKLAGVPLSVLTVVLNAPFLIVGAKKMGKMFIVKAAYAMVIFSVFLEVFEPFQEATDESLLAVCFGGVFLGLGVGLVIRFGGCLDGTETVAILLNRKFKWPVGRVVLICNVAIYSLAGAFFGLNPAMFSLLTYFVASKVMDMVEGGYDQNKAAFIITNDAAEIAQELYTKLGRTCTLIDAEGLVSGKKTILYCVLSKYELHDLEEIIHSLDASAFIAVSDVSEIIGTHVKQTGDKDKLEASLVKAAQEADTDE